MDSSTAYPSIVTLGVHLCSLLISKDKNTNQLQLENSQAMRGHLS